MIVESSQSVARVSPSFVIARRGEEKWTQLFVLCEVDYRRSNLLALIDPEEFFLNFNKTSFTREQREEIAVRMQHCLAA
jgi:hypothetical protein